MLVQAPTEVTGLIMLLHPEVTEELEPTRTLVIAINNPNGSAFVLMEITEDSNGFARFV